LTADRLLTASSLRHFTRGVGAYSPIPPAFRTCRQSRTSFVLRSPRLSRRTWERKLRGRRTLHHSPNRVETFASYANRHMGTANRPGKDVPGMSATQRAERVDKDLAKVAEYKV